MSDRHELSQDAYKKCLDKEIENCKDYHSFFSKKSKAALKIKLKVKPTLSCTGHDNDYLKDKSSSRACTKEDRSDGVDNNALLPSSFKVFLLNLFFSSILVFM